MIGFIKKRPVIFLLIIGIAAGCALCILGARGQDGGTATEEEKIKAMVESIDGVSDASVLISYSREEVPAFSTSREGQTYVTGIAVTAEGADLPKNRYRIINILSTAYSLPTNRIFVCGNGE